MKRGLVVSLVCLLIVLLLAGITIWQKVSGYPAPNPVQPSVSTTNWTNQTWYVKSDAPIAAYSCARIDCDVTTVLTNGMSVTVVGPPQGEALYPIRYGVQQTVYVADFWLSRQSPIVQPLGVTSRGATAVCRDAWVSFSQNRSGTCSHHKGVRTWTH